LFATDLDIEAADTRPISSTVITVGRRADNDSSVAAIAILPALTSEEERKLPSYVSLNVVKHVARACDVKNSQRPTTRNRTRQ
jgi:hypothetical protein